jgi:hypothetical protein
MKVHIMTVATTTLPIGEEVRAASSRMMITNEEEELTVPVAEVLAVDGATTLAVVAEEAEAEVTTTSTSHWMITAIHMMGHTTATVVEVRQEGATRWNIDLQAAFNVPNPQIPPKGCSTDWWAMLLYFFEFFFLSRGSACIKIWRMELFHSYMRFTSRIPQRDDLFLTVSLILAHCTHIYIVFIFTGQHR